MKRGQPKNDEDFDDGNENTHKRLRRTDAETGISSSAFTAVLENDDVASVIFSFLDVRTLFTISKTRKSFAAAIGHDHVVRSATFQGGHAKNSLERILPLVQHRSIWIPSPLRLLRLMNGRRCERCLRHRVNTVSNHYGVFFCFEDCITNRANTMKVAYNRKWNKYVNHPRLAAASYSSRTYLWQRPFSDTSGEVCGPLITVRREISDDMRRRKSIDAALEEHDASDPHASAVEKILQTYDDCVEAADQRAEEESARKKQANAQANQKREEKYLKIVDTLSKELGNDKGEIKNLVLSHKIVQLKSKRVLKFNACFMNEIFDEIIKAPSKATKKRIQESAQLIMKYLKQLQETKLFDLRFLCTKAMINSGSNEPDDSALVEKAIKSYFCRKYPRNSMLEAALPSLRTSRIHAIIRSKGNTSKLLLQLEAMHRYDVKKALAKSIVSSSGVKFQDSISGKVYSLARACYEHEAVYKHETGDTRTHARLTIDNQRSIQERFRSSVDKFASLFQNVCDFLEAPETLEWKAKEAFLDSDRNVWPDARVWTCDYGTIASLLERDFDKTRRILFSAYNAWARSMDM